MPDWRAVLRGMLRVVKPGGEGVSLELSHPPSPLFRWFYLLYFQRILPVMGKVFAGQYQQYRWLPQSLEDFPNAKELQQAMQEIGFARVDCYLLNGGIAAVHIGIKNDSAKESGGNGRQNDR